MKTTLIYISILIFLLVFSCKKLKEKELIVKEIETPIITDEFKLNFLNEILKDESNKHIYAYDYVNPYIWYENFEYTGNRLDVRYLERMGKPSTFPEYINSYFNSKDTTFIINQIKNNVDFTVLKLKDYGHNVIDWKTISRYDENMEEIHFILEDSLKVLIEDIENKGRVRLCCLLFNKELNMAHIGIYYFMSHGYFILYKKINNEWVEDEIIGAFEH